MLNFFLPLENTATFWSHLQKSNHPPVLRTSLLFGKITKLCKSKMSPFLYMGGKLVDVEGSHIQ